jgi:hypothetical protein
MVGEGAAVILYRVLSFNKNCKKLTGVNRIDRMNIGGKAHPGLELVPGLKSGMNGRMFILSITVTFHAFISLRPSEPG